MKVDSSTFNEKCKSANPRPFQDLFWHVKYPSKPEVRLKISGTGISVLSIFSAVILIDFDNSGYGYRAWDLLYFMSNWNYDFSRDDVLAYLYEYINVQTYSNDLKIEILLDEFKHHEPYFWLERILFLMVSRIPWTSLSQFPSQLLARSSLSRRRPAWDHSSPTIWKKWII